ncbi:hypothetical protein GY45DRAFT_1292230 [Cubamyces sp. BRFM 1775]|nr:hypothetical protein GY45DRAFT_1292230 [Cubamyces sp. BRFM 1775]
MPNVVYISEILSVICQYADNPTLAIMARSSRVLHEPAIEVLWTILTELTPLMTLFPGDAWNLVDVGVEMLLFCFTRPLVPNDWTRFLKYSALVRVLDRHSPEHHALRYRRSIALPVDVWDVIYKHRPTGFLFPNLRVLNWCSLKLPTKSLSSFILSAGTRIEEINIEELSLTNDARSEGPLEAIARVIIEQLPHLRVLALPRRSHNRTMRVPISHAIASLARALDSIVSFDCSTTPLLESALIALAQSKTLRKLALWLSDDADWPHLATLSASNRLFPCLQSLTLTATGGACIALSEAAQFPAVRDIRIEHIGDLNPTFSMLPTSIRRQFCPSTLTTVCVTFSGRIAYTNTTEVGAASLRPLLDFKRMENLTLYCPCRLTLNDVFLTDMAAAWPELRMLRLACASSLIPLHSSLPSLRVLSTLAARCPRLRTLALCFDATQWTTQEDFTKDDELGDIYGELKDRRSASRLRTLCTGCSPITSPDSVAPFLSRIFPGLSKVRPSGGNVNGERHDHWRRVDSLLPVLQAAHTTHVDGTEYQM